VNDLLVEEFERGKKTLWRLNFLVFGGAVVVANRMQHPSKAPRMQQVSTEAGGCGKAAQDNQVVGE